MNKKVLFLLGDIWSMNKNQGMPSVYKVLEASQKKFDIDIFTTDKHKYIKELPKAKLFYFNKREIKGSNKFYIYLQNRINNLILNYQYLKQFLKNRKKYDLIYCSSSIPIFATFVLKKIYKIKTIHRIYGTFLYKNLSSILDKIKKYEEVLLFKSDADKYIITNDGTFGDRVAKYFHIPDNKIAFLRNGVEKHFFKKSKNELRDDLGLDDDRFYFICISRLTGWKRVDRIIKAMNKITNNNISLLVIGDGDEKNNLINLSKNKNTKFIGSIPSIKVHKYLSAVDGFISMYDISNIGNPLLEALSYALPIITYNSGNTSDIIDGTNGILITETEEDKIIDKLYLSILDIYNNKILRENLVAKAKKYALTNLLTWDQRIDIELKIMEELINEK